MLVVAAVALILGGCFSQATESGQPSVDQPAVQGALPAEWPEEVGEPDGFVLKYALGGTEEAREDVTAQYVAFGDRREDARAYVDSLLDTGFALIEHREDLGIWILKGFGVRVEIVVDDAYPNLTWLAVSVFMQ